MSRRINKIFLVAVWVLVVFGYLWLMESAYEREESFHLFVLLAIAGNMAYDGLKAVIRYDPLCPSDATTISKYVAGFVVSLFASVGSLFFGAALFHWNFVNEFMGQLVAASGFLGSMILGMVLLGKAESRFRLSNRG